MKNNSKEVILKFNLPEFNKKDINVRLLRNSISVKAEKKKESRVQKKDFFHQEKSQKIFNYTTTIPTINPKKAKIEFKRGVLEIRAPKI
mgnify:CR=1 FL=1